MKKLIIIFLSIFIAIPNGYAADEDFNNYSCETNYDGSCPPGCGINDLAYGCTSCGMGKYNPHLNNSQACEEECSKPGDAIFTNVPEAYGNTSNYCPWELTCKAGQYWDGQKCSLCGDWIGDGNYSGYFTIKTCTISSRGTDMPDSNRYDICDGNEYKLILKPNGAIFQGDIELCYKYGTGFAEKCGSTTWSQNLPKHHENRPMKPFTGYYSDKNCGGVAIFDSEGNLNVSWSSLGGDKTLYACWKKLTQTIEYYDETGVLIPGSSHTCTADDNDNFECWPKELKPTGDGVIFNNYTCTYIPSNGDTKEDCTFTEDGQIPQLGEGTVRLQIQTKKCPAGHYCEAGTQTKCPGGSTSDIGAENINRCYMAGGEGGTQFCDSKGCFNLPGDTRIYYHGGDEANN